MLQYHCCYHFHWLSSNFSHISHCWEITITLKGTHNADKCFAERFTFCLVFRCQHSNRDVVGASLARCVGDSHLEGVDALLEPADLQQPRMGRLQRTQEYTDVNESHVHQIQRVCSRCTLKYWNQLREKHSMYLLSIDSVSSGEFFLRLSISNEAPEFKHFLTR